MQFRKKQNELLDIIGIKMIFHLLIYFYWRKQYLFPQQKFNDYSS